MDRSTRIRGKPKGRLWQRQAGLIAWVTLLTVVVVLNVVWLSSDGRASPKDALVVGAGLIVGLGLGVFLASVWDRHMGRMKHPSDVEASTGLKVLSVIPAIRLEGADRVAVNASDPVPGTQAYGILAAEIAAELRQSRANCILITSPTSRDGRTTTAVNLAVVLAAEGLRVALLSADPNGEGVDEMLGLQRQPGLTEVLNGSSSLDLALQPGGVERLRVLTAGGPSDEILGESIDGQALLLDRLTGSVDLIVIDAPPVLGGPEAVLMAQDVDLVLIVVDRRHGKRSDASLALSYLAHVQDRLVGCVVNDPGPRRSRRPRAWPGPTGDPAVSPSAPVGRMTAATVTRPLRRRGIESAAGAVRGRVASAASVRTLRRHPWAGVAIAVAVGFAMLVPTLWWLSYDGSTEAHDRTEVPDRSLTATATSSQAAIVAATAECRSTWDAQTAPLEAAETSLQLWQVHIDAMNQLVAGKITMDQANSFWERTRTRAAHEVSRFRSADGTYRAGQQSCGVPSVADDADAGLAALTACQQSVAQRDDTLGAARVAIDAWDRHVTDMSMLYAGTPSTARAIQLWNTRRRHAMVELDDYRSQLRQTDNRTC
jgi:Mrp family chromosome partitioning ATPase